MEGKKKKKGGKKSEAHTCLSPVYKGQGELQFIRQRREGARKGGKDEGGEENVKGTTARSLSSKQLALKIKTG